MKRIALLIAVSISMPALSGAQTLRQLADSRGIHFGAAVTLPTGANLAPYESTLSQQFNTSVCENAMKWQNTEGTRNVFNFTAADAIVDFTLSHGMYMRGHNFVWHSQVPGWVSNITNRDTLLAVMKNHINQLAGHYKGKIYEWDVVNEAIADGSTGFRSRPGKALAAASANRPRATHSRIAWQTHASRRARTTRH